ncbi:MAG: hypothetical protein JWN07_2147 [Hyphomicrobiales bacterium]|nr:hypothetical protein [Hyphomicrobiales bacterium]
MSRPSRKPPDARLLQAQVSRLIRPLVKLMIRSGFSFTAFMDLARKVYVDVALNDFKIEGKEQTDSRITLLTGVHRKEVRRLREEPLDDTTLSPELSRTSQIVARWLGGAAYLDAAGRPAPLPRAGEAPSFESLVSSITKDVRPRAVLDDWVDRGLVILDAQDRVTLVETAVIPKPGEDNQLFYFGRNLHDHIAAAAANVGGGDRLFLERAVHYDGLTADAAQRLETMSRQLAMQALEKANKEAQDVCAETGPGDWRWNFGLYVYLEPQGAIGSDTAARDPNSGVED